MLHCGLLHHVTFALQGPVLCNCLPVTNCDAFTQTTTKFMWCKLIWHGGWLTINLVSITIPRRFFKLRAPWLQSNGSHTLNVWSHLLTNKKIHVKTLYSVFAWWRKKVFSSKTLQCETRWQEYDPVGMFFNFRHRESYVYVMFFGIMLRNLTIAQL